MNFKILIPALLLTASVACNQSNNGGSENGSTPGTQDQQKNGTAVSEKNGVYFVNLHDGETVISPVIVQMGVTGMTVEPAGTLNEGKGHHHLIIDGTYIDKGQMVPKDETHLHFGKGQTVDTLKLSPGEHTLTLQFANGLHQSYGKDWSATIKITVQQ